MQVVLPDSDVQDLERGRNYNEIHPYCLFSPVLYHIPRHLIFWGGGESCIFTGGISLFSQLICLWSWIPCRNICIIETELGGLQCPEPGLGSKWAEEFRVLLQIPTNWTFASVINWHRGILFRDHSRHMTQSGRKRLGNKTPASFSLSMLKGAAGLRCLLPFATLLIPTKITRAIICWMSEDFRMDALLFLPFVLL